MNIKWEGCDPEDYTVGRGGHAIEFIVFHWIVGGMQALDREVDNDGRRMSPHYGIDGTEIWQFVKEEDTAYHCGNWDYNQRSIGIEHAGGEMQADGTRRKPSPETHEASAQLCAEIVRRHNIPVDRAHFIGHREVPGTATECPGSFDIDWVVNRVKEILAPAPAPEPQPAPAPAPSKFPKTVTVTVDNLRVRMEPNTQSGIVSQPTPNHRLNKGNTFTAVDRVVGEDPYHDGRNLWYKSSRGHYVWCGGCK